MAALIVSTAAATLSRPAAAVGDVDCRTRFKVEAPAGLEKLREDLSSVHGTVSWTRDFHSSDHRKYARDTWTSRTTEFWLTPSAGKVLCDTFAKDGAWVRREVACYNSEYSFFGQQDVQGGPYILTLFGRDQTAFRKVKGYVHTFVPYLSTPYDIDGDGRRLAEILVASDCAVESCSEIQRDGRTLKQLNFSFSPTTEQFKAQDPSTRHCTILLDPSNSWRLVQSVLRDANYTTTVDAAYEADPSNPARLKSITNKSISTDAKAEDLYTINYRTLTFEVAPASEFRLPAIGLPEIRAESHNRVSVLFWVGGNLLLLGLILFIYHARRSRSTTSRPED